MSTRVVRFNSGNVAEFKPTKYRNRKCEADGHTFDSKRERDRYVALKLRERAGEVRNIALQITYRLEVGGVLICKYRADFTYEERDKSKWKPIVEDVKGYRTRLYRLKKKLMKALHGIEVRET